MCYTYVRWDTYQKMCVKPPCSFVMRFPNHLDPNMVVLLSLKEARKKPPMHLREGVRLLFVDEKI